MNDKKQDLLPDVIYAYHTGQFIREETEGATKYRRDDLCAPVPSDVEDAIKGYLGQIVEYTERGVKGKEDYPDIRDGVRLLVDCIKKELCALQSSTQFNPETHVIVPREPTKEMAAAYGTMSIIRSSFSDCYKHMIAAAPPHEQEM